MNQIPNIHPEQLEQFDQRTVNPSLQKVGEKKRKDQFKKLIAGTVGVRGGRLLMLRVRFCVCVFSEQLFFWRAPFPACV